MVQVSAPPPDSVRAVLREVFRAPEYQWDLPRNPLQFLIDLWQRAYGWLGALEADHPGAYYVLIAAMSFVLVAILAHFSYLLWRALRSSGSDEFSTTLAQAERRGAEWHLEESRRLADRGLFAEALAHRFRALVLQLDEIQVVRFHPSKTPAEYAREAALEASPREEFSGLVADLYRYLFGGERCDVASVARFDERAAMLTASHEAH